MRYLRRQVLRKLLRVDRFFCITIKHQKLSGVQSGAGSLQRRKIQTAKNSEGSCINRAGFDIFLNQPDNVRSGIGSREIMLSKLRVTKCPIAFRDACFLVLLYVPAVRVQRRRSIRHVAWCVAPKKQSFGTFITEKQQLRVFRQACRVRLGAFAGLTRFSSAAKTNSKTCNFFMRRAGRGGGQGLLADVACTK